MHAAGRAQECCARHGRRLVRRKNGFVAIAVWAVAGLACGQKEDTTVARVADQPITVADFQRALKRLRYFGDDQTPRDLLQPLIDREIMRLEAEELGLGEAPEVMQAVEQARSRRLTEEVYDRLVSRQVVVSEEAMRAYFEEQGLDRKREVRASHIMLGSSVEAEALAQRLAQGADFAELARAVSLDTLTAAKGGDMGYWQEEDARHSPFIRELFGLSVGEVSEPYRNARGSYHLIKATEERTVGFERQKASVRKILQRQQRNERWASYLAEQKARFHLQVEEPGLRFLLKQGRLAQEGVPPIPPADRDRVLLRYDRGTVGLGAYSDMVSSTRVSQRPRSVDSAAVVLFAQNEALRRFLLPRVAVENGWDRAEAVQSHLDEKREQAMVELLRRIEVEDRILTDEAMWSSFESDQDDYWEPERTFFEAGIVSSEQDAQEITERVRGGQDLARIMSGYPRFSDRWRQYDVFSFCASDSSTGGQSEREVFDLVRGRPAGGVGGPFRVTFDGATAGYLVFRVLEQRPARVRSFDDPGVRYDVRLKLKVAHRDEIDAAFYQYMSGLRSEYGEDVVVYEQTLVAAVSD